MFRSNLYTAIIKQVITLSFTVLAISATAQQRPNILVILADDLGFSDLGSFGGEISTPNLDQLAHAGVRFTNLHTTPTCSPTRAELLTGLDHHLVGFSNMKELITPSQKGKPGYLGYLDPKVPTIAERLSAKGYRTIMSGKWHLGEELRYGPSNRGFEHAFTLVEGGHNHFGKPGIPPDSLGGATYREHGRVVKIPENFYSSDYFTDKLIEYLDAESDRPFFAYLSFTAPHWPLHAPTETIKKYRGKYDRGWDLLREKRIERQKQLGIITRETSEVRPTTLKEWDSLPLREKRLQAKKMEIYAAMVDRMDWNVGRVVDYLKKKGWLQNTFIVFLSDNGAAPDLLSNMARKVPDFPEIAPGSSDLWGGQDSILSYGPNWAQAATAPKRLYKSVTTEGGLVSPTIIYYEGFQKRAYVENEFSTVRDLSATIVDLAGEAITEASEKNIVVSGRSLASLLNGTAARLHKPDDAFGWELFGQRAIRKNDWKLVYISEPNGSGTWELYDLSADPSEIKNVSKQNRNVYNEMKKLWDQYRSQMGVVIEEQVVSPHNAGARNPRRSIKH